MSFKTVFITGCNKGIGKAIVERFIKSKNVNIILHARKETPEFSELISKYNKNKNVTLFPVYFDLQDSLAIEESCKKIIKQHKTIDILINNAGMSLSNNAFLMQKMETIRKVFDVNFFAQLQITQLVARTMIKNKKGNIINMASAAAFTGIGGLIEYVTSKAAIVGMTKRLAFELSPYNIRCNAIAPGMTDTDMMKKMPEDTKNKLLDNTFVKRLALPEEIANIAYFLASDESSFINGQVIIANGGTK